MTRPRAGTVLLALPLLLVAGTGPRAAPVGALAAGWLLEAPDLRELGPAEVAADPPRFPFPVGERLDYEVSWFGLPAGAVRVEIARFVAVGGRRFAHVVATARTHAVFSALYLVDDRSEGWIDLDRLVTVRTRSLERHGPKHYDENVRYDWDARQIHQRLDKLHKGQRQERTIPFGRFVHDTFDVVYALRAMPLAPGFSVTLPTYASRKVYALRLDGGEWRIIRTRALGAVPALALRPTTFLDGRLFSAGSGVVWASPEVAWAPLRLDGWIRSEDAGFLVAGLRVELVGYVPSAPGWPRAALPALAAGEVARP